ncbi:hypothetical protein LVD17_00745 [Fulvivirga ulvae]|uniref:hypothetical protein n=1 Tax=Fulvivirga ulvae TaxID=2904245 RepID=UPI001F2E156E|nr:hypothetical protein [Fulvivirga ulvae]UII32366.1 hypothetical protein LVD17_00745 [Fulvivirga ulvae]
MKTSIYNPSTLEVEIAQAIENMQDSLQKQLPSGTKIVGIENRIAEDNPLVKLFLEDNDGDPHEVVLKIIQTPDKF